MNVPQSSRWPQNAEPSNAQPPSYGDGQSGQNQAHINNYSDDAPQNQASRNAPNNRGSKYGFMAKHKFKSRVATLDSKKTNDAYIDSGATHHFFYARSSFISYETIEPDTVESTSGTSPLIGKGVVYLPIHGGVYMEAYHSPQFASNILSVGQIGTLFDVLFSSSNSATVTCYISTKGTGEKIWRTKMDDGLFKMHLVKPAASKLKSHQNSLHLEEDLSCRSCAISQRHGIAN